MSAAEESIVIEPATPRRWSDVRMVLDGDAERGCWCQAWRGLDAKAYSGGHSRRELLREQMAGGLPPPGYVAYLDGEPAGWVGVGLRSRLPRLAASRTIPAIDDLPVWAIGCFRVRPGSRRRGVARALLDGVVAAARAAGAPGGGGLPDRPWRRPRGGRRRLRRHRLDVRCGWLPPGARHRCSQRPPAAASGAAGSVTVTRSVVLPKAARRAAARGARARATPRG